MPSTFERLCNDAYNVTEDKSPDAIKAEVAISGSHANLVMRRLRRYWKAIDAAPKFGMIGVGAISFADYRAEVFSRRIRAAIDASHG